MLLYIAIFLSMMMPAETLTRFLGCLIDGLCFRRKNDFSEMAQAFERQGVHALE